MNRWQPPPMNDETPRGIPKMTVDERVVRKMLQVNPSMRKGRTTFQVKKSIERGDALAITPQQSDAPTSEEPNTGRGKTSAAAALRVDAYELVETIDFFVRGKADKLQSTVDEIGAKRRQLDVEETQMRAQLGDQLVSFVSLLDDGAIALHGKKALARHASFLAEVGLTPATLLDRINRKSK